MTKTKNVMTKKEAISYLEKKQKIRQPKRIKHTDEENKKIKEIMKEGKIYGDPIAEIQW